MIPTGRSMAETNNVNLDGDGADVHILLLIIFCCLNLFQNDGKSTKMISNERNTPNLKS